MSLYLVTGGAGFIGSHIADKIQRPKAEVSHRPKLAPLSARPLEFCFADLLWSIPKGEAINRRLPYSLKGKGLD